jgi:hypothetical protein
MTKPKGSKGKVTDAYECINTALGILKRKPSASAGD